MFTFCGSRAVRMTRLPHGPRRAGRSARAGTLLSGCRGLFLERQAPGPFEGCQVDVGDTADWVVVQDQAAFDVHGPGTLVEVRPTEIGGIAIQREAKFSAALCLGECYQHVSQFPGPV